MGGVVGAQQRNATAPISDRSHTKPIREEETGPIDIRRTSSPEPEETFAEKEKALQPEETKDSTSGDTITAEDTAEDSNTSEKPRQRRGLKGMFHREKNVAEKDKAEEDDTVKPHYTFANQIRGTLFNSWINILLIAGKR
jgi:FKBP-type peptidyl-prolyl cis-trans isomerase